MRDSDSLPQLSFREWKYLDAHLIWIYEGEPQIGAKEKVANRYFTAWCILKGGVEVRVADKRMKAVQGDWILLAPGSSDRIFEPDSRILSLHFEARWATGQALFDFAAPMLFDPLVTKDWRKLTNPMLKVVRRNHPNAYNRLPAEETDFERYAELQWYFQRWLARLWDAMRRRDEPFFMPHNDDPRSMGIKMRLDAQPLVIPFRLQGLAEDFELSPAQVNRIFYEAFETTPKRYFERRRLTYAKGAVSSSAQQIKEIGFAAGFRHQSEFSSWFKKQTGASPREFRAAARVV